MQLLMLEQISLASSVVATTVLVAPVLSTIINLLTNFGQRIFIAADSSKSTSMEFLSTIIGAGYPIYKTYLLLELPSKRSQLLPKAFQLRNEEHKSIEEERRRLMAYWCVYGCVTAAESILGRFLSWVPFYSTSKIVFWLWLLNPRTQGAAFIYASYISPFLSDHKAAINNFLEKLVQFTTRQPLVLNAWALVKSLIDKLPKGDVEAPGSDADTKKSK
uniref:Uncharacterized membrane protein C30D10.09c n=2 Tax=Schizosaccharomyces pombe (strain 972 / ATCC 24843) TaxID=284812 RepID=YB49_SCHPO|nr:HVA22/TB2/DP1 family protein [Schizosaccharomyces pombe]O14355.1 RecName: Full=Uncharacterized membrane protein C30D10.09c [Schizosaccharomyces pombe 972h-]CAB10804.1 HVA22/TB2/DP1 family protein [Schizosaccharomyces pombe]|eukprot:NP_596276.1 HVA22/TB2/DP1 family protein [Schizosaccharomyces pombe]